MNCAKFPFLSVTMVVAMWKVLKARLEMYIKKKMKWFCTQDKSECPIKSISQIRSVLNQKHAREHTRIDFFKIAYM